MPYRAASKVKGLYKKHNIGCANANGDPVDCNCPWYGKYKGISKGLAAWAGKEVNPRTKAGAEAVLRRFKTAIDDKKYSPEGEQQSLGSGQRFSDFVLEWKTHYAEEYGLTSNSLDSMLDVLTDGLGSFTLEHLAGDPVHIERWLNRIAKERSWSANTWCRYYELLSTICVRATRWKTNGVPRMAHNPMTAIERRVGTKKKFGVRIEEAAEDKLLEACDRLNRPQHAPHSKLLDWEKVDAIRKRVAAGEAQADVARSFGISTGLCCQIVKGEIWNRDKYKRGHKGRLDAAAADDGARHGRQARGDDADSAEAHQLPPRTHHGRRRTARALRRSKCNQRAKRRPGRKSSCTLARSASRMHSRSGDSRFGTIRRLTFSGRKRGSRRRTFGGCGESCSPSRD